MKDQILYILAFKDEPLIKVGLAYNIQFRSRSLGSQRFDFRESYLVRSKDQPAIRTLERNIKTFFSAHQAGSENPLANGNTETFRSEILPAILETLEAFRKMFPHADIKVQHDISNLIPIARPKSPGIAANIQGPRTIKFIAEIQLWRRANKIKQNYLAPLLGMAPQQLNNILRGRHGFTGRQVLELKELIRTKPVDPPQ